MRQLALTLLLADEAQARFHEKRLRQMPLPVLRKHGVISTDRDGLVHLDAGKLTLQEMPP